MRHMMIDLETLDTTPTAKIVSIGIQMFEPSTVADPDTPVLGADRYWIVNTRYGQENRTSSVATMLWWSERPIGARAVLNIADRMSTPKLLDVLTSVTEFMSSQNIDTVWGNGAAFDNVIMADAYQRLGMQCPWKFWKDRCYRTLKALDIPCQHITFEGTEHNALDDARYQARKASVMLGRLERAFMAPGLKEGD